MKNKPFFYRIDAADFFTMVSEFKSEKELGRYIKKLASEMITRKATSPYAEQIISEAVEYINKKREAGAKGGKQRASKKKAKGKQCYDSANSKSIANSSSSTKEEVKGDIVIPDFVPLSEWTDFLLNRERMKKPMSDLAKQKMFKKMDGLRDTYDLSAVLNRAILNNWQDIYVDDTCKIRDESKCTTPHWY